MAVRVVQEPVVIFATAYESEDEGNPSRTAYDALLPLIPTLFISVLLDSISVCKMI